VEQAREADMHEVKRFVGFSAMEWVILAMGLCGMVALWFSFPGTWWKIFCAGFGLGFLFESSMERLFSYHEQLSQRHCIGKTDVNFLFPFAWLNIVGCTVIVAERIPFLPLLPAYILSALLVGNVNEFFFFKCKFWRYNYREPMFGNFRPFVPVITALGVPIQVIAGYANVGIMTYWLTHILF
jgi:hypothetical protein